jgi:hypothetical protein
MEPIDRYAAPPETAGQCQRSFIKRQLAGHFHDISAENYGWTAAIISDVFCVSHYDPLRAALLI